MMKELKTFEPNDNVQITENITYDANGLFIADIGKSCFKCTKKKAVEQGKTNTKNPAKF